MCVSDADVEALVEVGRPWAAEGRGAGVRIALEVAIREVGARPDVEEPKAFGLGVAPMSTEGRRILRCAAGPGVLVAGTLESDAEASDLGGEGGSWISETVSTVEIDLLSGGVMTNGELAVDCGECSNIGDPGMERSVEMVERWRASCFLILSCRISASIFRSESSSRRRCDSTRSCSRSCSPILISSSNITPRSIATLYLDSRSSSDEVVLRACLSKSSLATSISRSFS